MLTDAEFLGGLDLESRQSGWQAQVRNTATFAASEKDDLDRLSQKLTEGVLNEYSEDLPWITRGHNFRFVLHLRFGTLLDAEEQQSLAMNLAAHLRVAKLWSQLSLVPTLVENSQAEPSCYTMSVSLEHCRNPAMSTTLQLHRLNDDVPFQDFRPPPGIPVVEMKSVHLDMLLERCQRKKRQKLTLGITKLQIPHQSELKPPVSEYVTGAAFPSCPRYNQSQGINSRQSNHENPPSGFADWLLDGEDGDLDNTDTDMLLLAEHEDGSLCENTGCGMPQLRKRSSSFSDLDIELTTNQQHNLLDLVDAAIRSSITDSRRHLPKDVTMTANESLQHLAPLAPSIWYPAYFPSMASRAVFIPTISNSIKTVLTHSGRSTTHRAKRADLRERVGPNYESGNTSPATNSEIPIETVSRLVWRLLSRGMHGHQAARHLAPLLVANEGDFVECESEFEMLDSGQVSLCSSIPYEGHGTCSGHIDCATHPCMQMEFCHGDEMIDDDLLTVCESLDNLDLLEEDDLLNELATLHNSAECLEFWEDAELLEF